MGAAGETIVGNTTFERRMAMPMPKPKKKENKQEFVSRCIADLTRKEEDRFPSVKQRAAICYSQWGETPQEKARAEKRSAAKKEASVDKKTSSDRKKTGKPASKSS